MFLAFLSRYHQILTYICESWRYIEEGCFYPYIYTKLFTDPYTCNTCNSRTKKVERSMQPLQETKLTPTPTLMTKTNETSPYAHYIQTPCLKTTTKPDQAVKAAARLSSPAAAMMALSYVSLHCWQTYSLDPSPFVHSSVSSDSRNCA